MDRPDRVPAGLTDQEDQDFASDEYFHRASDRPKKKRRIAKEKPLPPTLYKAVVKDLAEDFATAASEKIDPDIIAKIKKCLERGNHKDASELEAKAALRVATRLMGQYNVTQAEVLSTATEAEKKTHGGRSIVSVVHTDGSKKQVRQSLFIGDLAWAMGKFFDVKHFSTKSRSTYSLNITFYGIASNTVLAAMAYEMAYNLILDWARPKKGIAAKNSYCLGASYGLNKMAKEEKEEEMERAKKAEAEELEAREKEEIAQRQKELNRLNFDSNQAGVEDVDDTQTNGAATKDKPASPTKTVISIDSDSDPASNPGSAFDSDSVSDSDSDTSMNDFNTEVQDTSEEQNEDERPEDDNTQNPPDDSDDDTDFGAETNFTNPERVEQAPVFTNIDDEVDYLLKNAQTSIRVKEEARQPSIMHIPAARDPTVQPAARDPTAPPADSLPPEPEPEQLNAGWKSKQQLILFHDTAMHVADDFLKTKGVKLYKGKKHAGASDKKAWREGEKDSRKINVHRKTLKESSEEGGEGGEDGEEGGPQEGQQADQQDANQGGQQTNNQDGQRPDNQEGQQAENQEGQGDNHKDNGQNGEKDKEPEIKQEIKQEDE
ncbi:uncharacterized protein K452DRAFT_298316 [Aplosporella prunicola CBS 121167]|uniref:Uncharacterized protein n=1 Tax=Aplosporella prunicola CBS 121167 TaxID=1176127 RepID=A0A6A6BBY2_9PEZI|nr:uncharacterized protein K452DRAFT_298316 [Aplosporella prunicola CBS 121167]KAF2141630.1 hypothetical protein K452DRAFT_298316 [Aplosporella prunicola CBS 121167]